MTEGYIKLYRKLMKHPLWEDKPFSKGQAWIDLLLLANHKQARLVLGRSFVTAGAGQIVTSEVKLAARWGWSRQKVRNFLLLLKSDNMLTQSSCSSHTVLTLCNYSIYNKPPERSEPEAPYLDFR